MTFSTSSAGSTSAPAAAAVRASASRSSTPSLSGVRCRAVRGHNDGSMYFDRSKKRWIAAVTMPDGSRRTKQAPATVTKKADCKPTLDELLLDRDAARDPDANSPLGPFLRRWLDEIKPGVRPSTYRTYSQIVTGHLVPALGKTPISKLTPAMVSAHLRRMGETVSAQTVNHDRAVLRSALAMANRWGILTRNVAALADAPRVERRELTVLDADQVRKLLDVTKTERLHALWAVAATTGMRQGEILGLTWRHVDITGGSLRVERTLARIRGQWVLVEPKTQRSRRTIPLTPVAIAALRRHKRIQEEEWLAAGRPAAAEQDKDRLVFTTPAGSPMQGSEVTKRLQRRLKAAGLPKIRFHDLRHGAATLLLAAGFNLEDVKNLLGHSTIALTSNTYGHYVEKRGREVAAGMARAIGGAS